MVPTLMLFIITAIIELLLFFKGAILNKISRLFLSFDYIFLIFLVIDGKIDALGNVFKVIILILLMLDLVIILQKNWLQQAIELYRGDDH